MGLGLGFDFKRIEVVFTPSTATPNHCSGGQLSIHHILIDGISPQEWSFHVFTTPDGEDHYVGATAEQLYPAPNDGDSNLAVSGQIPVVSILPPERFTVQDAVSFAQEVISALQS